MEMDKNIENIISDFMENDKKEKIERFIILNQYVKKGQILFTGSSLMEQFPIYEFVQNFDIDEIIYNRGIGGFTTLDMLNALKPMVFDLEPSKIFINIGTNDINMSNFSMESLIERYTNILTQIIKRLPLAKIYVMAYYPVNEMYDFGNEYIKETLKLRTNARIEKINFELENMALKLHIKYINVNNKLYDENKNLKKEYSIEGMHMYASGYHAILNDLMVYIME